MGLPPVPSCLPSRADLPARGCARLTCKLHAHLAAEAAFVLSQLPPPCRHFAAEEGHAVCLHKVLAVAPAAAQLVNSNGETPTHLAAIKGHTAALDEILAVHPTSAAAQDLNGWTPLHDAAARGHTAAVERLLAACPAAASVRQKDNGSALYLAAQNGHEEVATLLLDAAPGEALGALGAAYHGMTPAHIAAERGHAGAMQRILKAAPEASQAQDLKASCGQLPDACCSMWSTAH